MLLVRFGIVMKCPWCGEEVSTEEYSRHLKTCSGYVERAVREEAFARIAGPVYPPEKWIGIEFTPVQRAAIGNLLKRRVKWWSDIIEEDIKLREAKAVTDEAAREDITKFSWSLQEAVAIAGELRVANTLLKEMENIKSLAFHRVLAALK